MASISVTNILEQIVTKLFGLISKGGAAVGHQFIKAGDTLLEETFQAFTFPFTGQFLLQLTATVIDKGADKLKPSLASIIKHQTGSPNLALGVETAQGFEQFVAASASVGSFFYDNVLDIFAPEKGIDPESAAISAQRFVGLNLLLGTNAWLYSLLADVLSIGHLRAVGDLPLRVAQSLGLNRLTRFILAPTMAVTVGDPLKAGVLRKYLPNTLKEGDVLSLHAQGLKDDPWFKDQMLNFGFDNDTALLLAQVKARKFSAGELKTLYDHKLINDDQLSAGVNRLEYSSDDAAIILDFIKHARIEKLKDEIAKEAMMLYVDGRLDQFSLTDLLTTSDYQPLEIQYAIQLSDLKKLKKTLSEGQLAELYKAKLIDASGFHSRLTGIGYSEADASSLVSIEQFKEMPKPPKVHIPAEHTLTIAEILKAYQDQIFDSNTTTERLKPFGFTAADIQILKELHAPKIS